MSFKSFKGSFFPDVFELSSVETPSLKAGFQHADFSKLR